MMQYAYRTIAKASSGIFKDRGSKFYAYAYPVSTEDDIKARLAELQATHPKARHNCYAYRLGTDGNNFRANDAGEPNHSAGIPILGQIDSFELTNILIVVVRYFGGTKLGIPGLIKAYKSSAAEAIEHADIISKELKLHYSGSVEYDQLSQIHSYLNKHSIEFSESGFDPLPVLSISLPVDQADAHLAFFQNLTNVELKYIGKW